ncbi:MAG TPA: hypothetical protein VEH31_29070 [Streptosporangiaceae bacterium]|nr:hypothetical protein [Streptosporangiaceae bacterium]
MQHRTPGRTGIKALDADPEFETGLYLTVCAIVNAFNVPVPAGTHPESSAP